MKTQILEALGETALALPGLIATALQANDRTKYYMSLLQACRERTTTTGAPASDLRAERTACGENDDFLDQVVAGSRATPDGVMFVPHARQIVERVFASIEQMLAPFRATPAELNPSDVYASRLEALRRRFGTIADDTLPAGYVEAMTHADRRGDDSVHLLVMDLHRELNRAQLRTSERSLDGAAVYGLSEADEPLVRAFMRGLQTTAALKFDHPGLATTATRAGGRLIIQNDIGTTDAHVLVVHVEGLRVSFVYTDVHHLRLRFFRDLLERAQFAWTERGTTGGEYVTLAGTRPCSRREEIEDVLALLGSRLVFLIDWNRARKRLSRFMSKADAVAALRWAADRGIGHRAFLEAGGERLIYNAFERVAFPQLRSGARLDELLGRDAALAFIQAVLRITSDAWQQHASLRLVRDQVQAELLEHLHNSQQGVLGLASDHAALVVALAMAVRDAIDGLREQRSGVDLARAAERAKRWETKADDIVNRARSAQRQLPDADLVGQLLPCADDIADGLEEAMFLTGLLSANRPGAEAIDALARLAGIAVAGAEEYVKCVEIARDVRRNGTRDDVQHLLIAVDRVISVEHESDEAERQATAAALTSSGDFRSLHVYAEIAHAIEAAVDALGRSALMVKDAVMAEMLVA
jgi:uncharacterized protein Yka (UPF0111/DUF47 family)